VANQLFINTDGTIELEHKGRFYAHARIRWHKGSPLHRPSWVDDAEWENIQQQIANG